MGIDKNIGRVRGKLDGAQGDIVLNEERKQTLDVELESLKKACQAIKAGGEGIVLDDELMTSNKRKASLETTNSSFSP